MSNIKISKKVYLVVAGFILTFFSGVNVVNAATGYYYHGNSSTAARAYDFMLYAPTAGWTSPTNSTQWKNYWNLSRYQVMPTSDASDVSRMLRQQIFIHNNGPRYQVRQGDGYTGLYKKANGNMAFQITGTAVPYRYFHTTSENHRTSILVKVKDASGREVDFRHYSTRTLPIDQSGRYMYRFSLNLVDKNARTVAQPQRSNGTPSPIVKGNYFQQAWNPNYFVNMPRQVDRVCGLGIHGAYIGTNAFNQQCNYLYEWAGFQANIDVTQIINSLASRGINTDNITMEFRLVYEQTSNVKGGPVNVTVAPLDIVQDIGGSQTQQISSIGKQGRLTLKAKEGTGTFELKEGSLLKRRIVGNSRSLIQQYFPKGTSYYNKFDRQRDSNGFRTRRGLKIINLTSQGGDRGIYFGWDLAGNGTYDYAPNDYFYTHNHTAYLHFVTKKVITDEGVPDVPEIENKVIHAHFRNIDAPSKPVGGVTRPTRVVEIKPDSTTVVSNSSFGYGSTIKDSAGNGREWRFVYSGNPTYSRPRYTIRSNSSGIYDVLRSSNKNLTDVYFYYKRYDDVQIRYEDVYNKGKLVAVPNNPKSLKVGFNERVSHAAPDEIVDADGVRWSFIEARQVDSNPSTLKRQTQTAINNVDRMAPLVYYYEPYEEVEVAHRQILRGSSAKILDGVKGETLATDIYEERIGRYIKVNARGDNTLTDSAGRTGYNYVGLVSVDGGNTIRRHKTRTLEHRVSKDMDTLVFYYGIPVNCDTANPDNVNTPTILSCIEGSKDTSDRKDFVLPYVNGYLTKLGNVDQYDAPSSVYVYNYAPIIKPEGVFAVRNVTSRAIHGSDTVESTNNKNKIYLSDEVKALKVAPYHSLNPSPDINLSLRLTEEMDVADVEDLYDPSFSGNDMTNWTDGLSISYQVNTDELNTDTGGVRFLLDYTYIDEVRHNYEPTLVHDGRTYIAEYVGSNLNLSNQKAVRVDTNIDDAAVDYGEYMGTLKNTEYKYSVGFERIPVPKTDRGGPSEPWFEAEYERYYEAFALQRDGYGSYDPLVKDFEGSDIETQQAIDISNRLYYHNDLNATSLPYVNSSNRSDRTDLSNTLSFKSDNMWYLIDDFDNNNQELSQYGVNLEDDEASKQALDELITKPVNAEYLPDLLGTHASEHKRAIPLVYKGYTGNQNTKGQYLDIETKDIFGVGSDSGLQYISSDVRNPLNTTSWQAGYTLKSGVLDSDATQLGRKVNRQAEYVNAMESMGYEPSDNDTYITTKEGSLYYIPLHNGLNTTHRNRLLVGGLGLNDATIAQEDIITYEKYLYGLGSDAVYTPQREVVEAGRDIDKSNVHYYLTGEDTNKYDTVSDWKVANGTRMMYTHIIKDLLQ